ncbi:hypothetical protein TPHA_0C03790 [Tetrapisispora phaffii CBS 4417]|uniref:RRM Nup35-type domain-containing protein n=1 Tax=Tetrapisispora phaffii (strain ATCC 24235 / CBS 4417 / NBRC 1672 / NRRL Y-8282 / UCD 70-5) TaxID=1071381 RepID=G8BQL9_TETPH|nr:hypothetical protein TPHA_0C03790 [Tetrapisispora phaffii CBS 4417]CCE62531.1 hypothetical protein TPHA_0C03790 [Tetrapisispora phaffii CBS 4417]
MFNSGTSSNNNRFSNVSINFLQPSEDTSQQQGNQQKTYHQLQNNSQQSYIQLNNKNKPLFANDLQSQFDTNMKGQEPEWFNNPKKRNIPQNVIRRNVNENNELGKQSSTITSSTSFSSSSNALTTNSGFENMSFGSRKSTNLFNSKNAQNKNLEGNNILVDSNEAPPTLSLLDWQREEEFGVSSKLGNNSSGIFMESLTSSNIASGLSPSLSSTNSSNQILSASAFDSKPVSSLFTSQEVSGTSRFEENNSNTITPSSSTMHEGAVLVFGYPESISNSIISHFAKFGNILEDFQVLRSTSGITASTLKTFTQNINNNNEMKKKYPIYTGDGWVKLTYDSNSSAIRALQENGIVIGGSLVGCIPYSKAAVEQLASCKIEKSDDIGNFNFSSTNNINFKTPLHNNNDKDDRTNSPSELNGNTKTPSYLSHRLDIKDGKSLFLHNANTNNHNFLRTLEMKMRHQEELNIQHKQQQTAGLLHKVNDWLFGWNDL